MAKGSLKTFPPSLASARALAQGYSKFLTSQVQASKSGADGTTGGKGASATDVMDLIGAAGMVFGAIKHRDGDQRKMVITMSNSSPHVLVPYRVNAPTKDFYCIANMYITMPGESCEVDLDVNDGFYYSGDTWRDFQIHFAVVASNGKFTKCILTCSVYNGEYMIGRSFSAEEYGNVDFPAKSADSSEYVDPYLIACAAEGMDDNPSFAVSMMRVRSNAEEDGITKFGFNVSAWNVGTIGPSPTFTVPDSGTNSAYIYPDSSVGAVDFGKLAWNYLKRKENFDSSSDVVTRGAVAFAASAVTMGVNLVMGARNMKRKDNNDHKLTVSVKNYTSYPIMVAEIQRSVCCTVDNPLIPPNQEGTINLGTRNFAGSIDYGPSMVFNVSNDVTERSVNIKLCDTTKSGFSGQIRVRSVLIDGEFWEEDDDGTAYGCDYLKIPFYKSPKDNGGTPQFMMMATPVGKGNADITIVFIN